MEDQKIKEHADKQEATDAHLRTRYSKKTDIIIVCQLPVHQKLSYTSLDHHNQNSQSNMTSQSQDGAAPGPVKPA